MTNSKLQMHKSNISAQLKRISPFLRNFAMGDFSKSIPIPQKEDEFTELLAAINLMVDDFREMLVEKEETIEELRSTQAELEQHKENLEELVEERSAALHESTKRYYSLFEGARDGFVSVDRNGKFIEANKGYCDMLGYTLEELKEKNSFSEITPKKWHKWELEEVWLKKLLQEGHSDLYEKEYIRKDGTIFPVEIQAYTVFNDKQEPEYVWGVVRDITDRKQAEKELQKAHNELEQRIEERTEELCK